MQECRKRDFLAISTAVVCEVKGDLWNNPSRILAAEPSCRVSSIKTLSVPLLQAEGDMWRHITSVPVRTG